jgi:hypothetical protein
VTTAVKDQSAAPIEPEAGAEAPVSFLRPVDAELLVTMTSRMHCRAPMQLVDPDATPLYQPVHVDIAPALPAGPGSPASVDTYRCACGFTLDVPAATLHALAS